MREKFSDFIHHVFSIREGTDVRGTIDSIRNNIKLRGYNVWLLITSSVIASIGLDMGSPAVIIGAMLISPLMSPILGVGLSIGINDRETLFESLENLSVAVVASMVTSTIYFLITPFGEANFEIMSRTRPTLLDVAVGFFGGVAGIVANSRKEKTSAIPGVAIATALMPPLCVTGYGMANMIKEGTILGTAGSIFWGAFYLFFLNAVFIALSTYLIVRYLNFPYMDFVNEETRKKVSRWMAVFVIALILPSGYLLYRVLDGVRTNRRLKTFVEQEVNDNAHRALDYAIKYGNPDTVEVVVTGRDYIDSAKEAGLKMRLRQAPYKLNNCELVLLQLNDPDVNLEEYANQTENKVKAEVLKMMEVKEIAIDEKEKTIQRLEAERDSLLLNAFGFERVQAEVQKLYPDMLGISYSMSVKSNFEQQDTIPLVMVEWNKRKLSANTRRYRNERIGDFIKVRLDLDTLKVVEE